MSAKKKILIATILFLIMIMLTIFTVVSVLAAQNVTIQSGVNVTYEVKNIVGTISSSNDTPLGLSSGSSSISLTGTEANQTYTKTYGTITLGYANNYIDFSFEFTNSGSAPYTVTITQMPTPKNLNLTYEQLPSTISEDKTSFTVPNNVRKVIKFRYTIIELREIATLTGSFNWKLTT